MDFTVDVRDIDRAVELLQAFPKKLQEKVLTLAAVAGAKVLVAAAKASAPVSSMTKGTARGWSAKTRYRHAPGLLRRAIAVRVVSRAQGTIVLSVKPQNRRAFYWWFVERGTRPHSVASRKVSLSGKTTRNRTVRLHPGARAQPFLLPVVDSHGPQATAAVQRVLVNAIDALQAELSHGH